MSRGGYLVVDLETIPDPTLYRPPEIRPGEEKPFPPIYAHQPVAIGALWLAPDLGFQRLGIIGDPPAGDEPAGAPEGEPAGAPEGEPAGAPESEPAGAPESEPEGAPESEPEDDPEAEGEASGEKARDRAGVPEGNAEADAEARKPGKPGKASAYPDERAQLLAFSEFVDRHSPTLVTWNGRGFDLPVLVLRCLRHGVTMPWYYRRSTVRHRYSDEGHLDLADVLADRGATRMTSLDNAARLIGLPGKLGVDGSQVDGLFRAGRLEEIRRYCLTDVIQTGCLFLRYLLLAGRQQRDEVIGALEGLLAALEADGRFTDLLEGIQRDRLLLKI